MASHTKANTNIATRALVVGLKSAACGKTTAEVHAITGLSKRTIQDIFARAIQRGFDPNLTPVVIHDNFAWNVRQPNSM